MIGHPYRGHRLEGLGRDDSGLMPVSPVYGPDKSCPKCGAKTYLKWYIPDWEDKSPACSKPKFCYEHRRFSLRYGLGLNIANILGRTCTNDVKIAMLIGYRGLFQKNLR